MCLVEWISSGVVLCGTVYSYKQSGGLVEWMQMTAQNGPFMGHMFALLLLFLLFQADA